MEAIYTLTEEEYANMLGSSYNRMMHLIIDLNKASYLEECKFKNHVNEIISEVEFMKYMLNKVDSDELSDDILNDLENILIQVKSITGVR